MVSVKEITEKILIYFRKHTKKYKQVYEVYLAIQKASLYVQLGSQAYLCTALGTGLGILYYREEIIEHIPEFNFKWMYENMPEEYKPNHPRLYEYRILRRNLRPGWSTNESNCTWWIGDQEWCKKARLKALEVLAEHYHNKLQQILQGKKV